MLPLPDDPLDLELLRQLLHKTKHTPLKAQTGALLAKKNSAASPGSPGTL